MNGKVFVGMSGGVDSAVAAALLKQDGYDVTAIFIKAFEDESAVTSSCPWQEDQAMVSEVCLKLNIPWETWNFVDEYRRDVLEYFFREYASGRTPNPDVLCNSKIKFGAFLDRSIRSGADFVATGHYARTLKTADGTKLLAGSDPEKDQSYFLYRLKSHQLEHVLFPLGELTKSTVRRLAKSFSLPNADRKDSQGICFVGRVALKDFLKKRIHPESGLVRTTDGEIVGQHHGGTWLTIGQRKGIGIGGRRAMYVVAKDPETKVVTVAENAKDPSLFTTSVHLDDVSWVMSPPGDTEKVAARLRYRQTPQSCTVTGSQDSPVLKFDLPQRAVTPGQSAVLYRGEEVIGGGIITN